MVFATQLRVPGPTPLPERVIRAQSKPLINHRGPEFAVLLESITTNLQSILDTTLPVALIPGSGTFGLEVGIANLLSPGDAALFVTCGYFGERWISIAKAYGVNVVPMILPWGEAIDPVAVSDMLDRHPEVKVVFATHNETSTGVTNDIPTLSTAVHAQHKLFAVDSVSGAGALPISVDVDSIDLLVTASQKGWMAPPGIAMVTANAAAMEASHQSRSPKWVFDLERYVTAATKGQTPTTPPLSTLFALEEGLIMMQEEGKEELWNRHARIATMIRAGILAMGLDLFAPEPSRSDTVTSIINPCNDEKALSALLTHLRVRYGLILAGGQGELMGKIFRIGHLGYINDTDAFSILATLEQALFELGYLSRIGFAVAAAQTTANAWAFDEERVPAGHGSRV